MEIFDNCNKTYFGLDFGTHSSIMAVYDGEESSTVMYPSAYSGGLPSLFWRDSSGHEYICDEVSERNGLVEDPNGICSSIKMKLRENRIKLNGHNYKASDIAIKELKYILNKSEKCFDEDFIKMDFDRLVVGTPVGFNAAQKGELLSILKKATGNKKIRLVPEPILAAIAYSKTAQKKGYIPRDILVYDLGAGTFDCAYLQPNLMPNADNPYPYSVKSQNGSDKAGDLIDKLLSELIIEKLKSISKFKVDEYVNKTHAASRYLLIKSKELKEKLSNLETVKATIAFPGCSNATIEISRSEFEKKIEPVIGSSVDIVCSVLNDSENPQNFDILLVGGSSYIPCIQKVLLNRLKDKYNLNEKNIFRKLPEKAVAMGAAIFAAEPNITCVQTIYGYGFLVFDEVKEHDIINICMPSNVNLPETLIDYYYTRYSNQTEIEVPVYEVKDAKLNDTIDYTNEAEHPPYSQKYCITHSFGKEVPKNTPIKFTTTLTESGTLSIEVDDMGISEITVHEIKLTNISSGGKWYV